MALWIGTTTGNTSERIIRIKCYKGSRNLSSFLRKCKMTYQVFRSHHRKCLVFFQSKHKSRSLKGHWHVCFGLCKRLIESIKANCIKLQRFQFRNAIVFELLDIQNFCFCRKKGEKIPTSYFFYRSSEIKGKGHK